MDYAINFTQGDTSGLTTIIEGIEKIIEKEGEVGTKWQDTSNEIKSKSTELVGSVGNAVKSIASLQEAIVGGSYAETLTKLKTEIANFSKMGTEGAKKIAAQMDILFKQQDKLQAALKRTMNPELVKKYELALKQNNEQINLLSEAMDQLQSAGNVFDEFVDSENKTEKQSVSLRTQLKQLREELAAMETAGDDTSEKYIQMSIKAGKLDDQIKDLNNRISFLGSDTRNIDGLISIASGVTGAFAAAQGAAALFGNQNDDLQKALLKVNAAMSILQGLQAVANVLQKESAGSLFLDTLFRKKSTAATIAQTAATEGATGAQQGLNAAMKANPAGLIITGIMAVVTALALFSNNSEDSKEKSDRLSASLDALNDAYEKLRNIDKINQSKPIDQLERELDLAKQQGASKAVILKKEEEILNAKLKNNSISGLINVKEGDRAKAIENVNGQLAEQQGEIKRITGLIESLSNSGEESISFVDKTGKSVTKNLDQLTKDLNGAYKSYNDINDLTNEYYNTSAQLAQKQAEIVRNQIESQSKSSIGFAEAEVARKKKLIIDNEVDSVASIKSVTQAEIAAIEERRKASTSKALNPDITAGEIAKINADAANEIAELKRKEQVDLLNIEKSGINARLLSAKEGSQEEFNTRLELLGKEQQIELAATQLTQEQINEIKAKYDKQRSELFAKRNAEEIDQEITGIDIKLSKFGISEQEKLNLTLDRLEKEKNKELELAIGNGQKMALILLKYANMEREAKISSIDAVAKHEQDVFEANNAQRVKSLNQIISSQYSTPKMKTDAVAQLKEIKLQELAIEEAALLKKKDLDKDYELHYQQFLNKKRDTVEAIEKQITEIEMQEVAKRIETITSLFESLTNQFKSLLPQDAFSTALSSVTNFGLKAYKIFADLKAKTKEWNDIIAKGNKEGATDADRENAKIAQEEKNKAIEDSYRQAGVMAIQASQDIINGIYADSAARRQQQLEEDLAALEAQKAKELDNKNLTEQQKRDIEEKYKRLENQKKREAFIADKEAKKQQAIINGALAIAQTFATLGFIAGWPFAALMAAQTAMIVAKISSTPVPKFKKGQIDIQGPGTGTSDSIPAMISRGESVIKADSTAKWKDALTAINNDKFELYLESRFRRFAFPQVPDFIQEKKGEIDYKKLASEIASQMAGIIPAPAQVHIKADKGGFSTWIKNGNSLTQYKNERYSMS